MREPWTRKDLRDSSDRPADGLTEFVHPNTLLGDRLSELVDAPNQLAGEGCLIEVVL